VTGLRPTTRVARGATYLFIQGFASAAISLIYFIFLARTLSNVEMGVYALLSFTLNLVPVLGTLALPSAVVKYLAQYLAKGHSEKAKSLITRLLEVWSITSILAFVFLFFPAELLSKFMFGRLDYSVMFRLLALCAAFTILHLLMIGCLQGLQRIRDVALINFMYAALQSTIGIFLLMAGLGLLAVVLSWLTSIGTSSLIGLVITLKHLGFRSKPHPFKPLFKFSYPLYIANIIFFASSWADQLIIVSYATTVFGSEIAQEWLGIYHVAVRASLIPMLFSTAIVTALFPQLSELYVEQGLNSLKEAFRISTRYLALFGFPMITGLAALSKPIVLIFAGQNYARAVLPLTIICFAALPVTLGVAIGPILLTLERTKVVSFIRVVSILFNLTVSYIAMAYLHLGLPGPALARTFSAVITFGLNLFVLSRIFSLNFDKEALWKAALSSLFMVLMLLLLDVLRQVVMPFRSEFFSINLYLLILYMVAGGATYFMSLVALKTMKESDIEMLRDYLPRGFKWLAAWLKNVACVD
jgi:O-antigen/teichoic acid export membrane protein